MVDDGTSINAEDKRAKTEQVNFLPSWFNFILHGAQS